MASRKRRIWPLAMRGAGYIHYLRLHSSILSSKIREREDVMAILDRGLIDVPEKVWYIFYAPIYHLRPSPMGWMQAHGLCFARTRDGWWASIGMPATQTPHSVRKGQIARRFV